MKTIIALTATAAALMAFTTASIASDATVIFQGCEMTRADNGNYLFKTDPGCVYTGFGNDGTVGGVGVTDGEADADE